MPYSQTKTNLRLDEAVRDLRSGANNLRSRSPGQLADLVDLCAERTLPESRNWVRLACDAKSIDVHSSLAAEEILGGPASFLRYLRLLGASLRQIENSGRPLLPGSARKTTTGQWAAPIFPVKRLFDPFIFMGLKSEIWLPPGSDLNSLVHRSLAPASDSSVCGVLGAGNVSAIPATDLLYKIFHDREVVLLKLNPVNEYLLSPFEKIFQPLIEQDMLRIVTGGVETGNALVTHPGVDTLHITGSHITHDLIVWGADAEERKANGQAPIVQKPITSELGNVTPWIIVPGEYSNRQLEFQAQHVAASITNNASFNCLATKVIVTEKDWPQREKFLNRIEELLGSIPTRVPYYPGARERFERATGRAAPQTATLPWTLLRNSCFAETPHLFQEESFVCVCAETTLSCSSSIDFLEQAVSFVNDSLFGTLSASITVPNSFLNQHRDKLESAIAELRYGNVCINQWSGVAYGLMTPPWGGHPGATLQNPLSGIGHVHNTFWVEEFDKAVLWGPLCNFPKPVWFPTHRKSHHAAWALLELYATPSLSRLPKLFYYALTG